MKLFIYIVIVLFAKVALAQKDSAKAIEVMPEFPGGAGEMMKFFSRNTHYPQLAKETNINDRCYLNFIVDSEGKITNIKIIKGIDYCPSCNEEAIRVLKLMPNWKPGTQNGKPVPVSVNVPFKFNSLTSGEIDYNNIQPVYPFDNNTAKKIFQTYKSYELANGENNLNPLNISIDLNDKGQIMNPALLSSSGNKAYDNEILKLIEFMEDWKPAMQGNTAVPVKIIFPINRGKINKWDVIFPPSKPKQLYPIFRGGPEMMTKFINKNLEYPVTLKKQGVVGATIVKFMVDSTGKIINPVVRQSSGYSLFDEEAIRIIKSMPNWIPGRLGNQRLNLLCDLTISFGNKEKLHEIKEKNKELSNTELAEGKANFQSENLSGAKEKYKKSYTLNCYNYEALYNLGITYFRLNQKDSACYCWKELKENFAKKEADELIKKYCSN